LDLPLPGVYDVPGKEVSMATVGSRVIYTDPVGREHDALVTADWGNTPTGSINLVYVSDDEASTDQYGRQIERKTSVVHKESQAAPGNFWHGVD
jgi:hypothetical protein